MHQGFEVWHLFDVAAGIDVDAGTDPSDPEQTANLAEWTGTDPSMPEWDPPDLPGIP